MGETQSWASQWPARKRKGASHVHLGVAINPLSFTPFDLFWWITGPCHNIFDSQIQWNLSWLKGNCLVFCFLGLMRCESYNANKFNIMFHVCSLVVMSEFPLNLKLQQERIKTCNSKPNSLLKKLFKGSWRCPAFLKNQSGKLPEPSNSPINWKQMKSLSKPNASQKRVLSREMKGIWEK